MKANCYKGDAAEEVRFSNASDSHKRLQLVYQEDPMKPILDEMILGIVNSLSGSEKDTYDREFTFFGEVTSISGKLKPYIKKTKAEKKVRRITSIYVRSTNTATQTKIDEEMAKIKIADDVYLPSNPDGKVIDIDKKSGRPLQSHAKVLLSLCSLRVFSETRLCRHHSWRHSRCESTWSSSIPTPIH